MIFLVAWVMKQIDKGEAEHEAKLLAWLASSMQARYCKHHLRELTQTERDQMGWWDIDDNERVFRCMSLCGHLVAVPVSLARKVWRS